MIQLRLQTKYHHVDLVANESATNISFQVVGPASEAAFVEEIICQRFGSLRIPPIQLFDFYRMTLGLMSSFPQFVSYGVV